MTKPPHTDTIELTQAQILRGVREQAYAVFMTKFRAGKISDDEWHEKLQDRRFAAWLVSL